MFARYIQDHDESGTIFPLPGRGQEMTDYTKISPLPWKREGSAWLGGVDSAEGDTVLTDEGVGMPGDLDYIVRAANSFPKLIEALKQALQIEWTDTEHGVCLDCSRAGLPIKHSKECAYTKISAALREAGEL
jgi:hypothetical protein